MKHTIYFDEAGNTGQDLLNQQQKVFSLASVQFNQEQQDELSKIFDNGGEIHFKKLKNSSTGRKQIIDFINHELICEQNIISSTCHKKFATVAQIVDQLIEPVFYDNGIDLYIDGRNLIYTNYLFYLGELVWDKTSFNKVLESFIKMMRQKDDDSINAFYSIVNDFSESIDVEFKETFINPIIESREQIEQILESVTKFTLDVTLSSFLNLCDLWHKKHNAKINIVFDNSKQIEFYKEFIEFMKQMNVKTQEVGYGNRKMVFPTQIDTLTLKDSSTELSLQFADLVASTITFMYSNENEKHKSFVENIKKSKLLKLSNCHVIWPYPNFSPKDLGMENSTGNNPLDFIADYQIKNNL
ncbi:DUF3800 domain-containing protein [Psychroserpens ponticola]|uniref:DUF3800 domain-containing protein n=1 Tax=Psychroserpens ponticola TaxID=2932268 RepID=A0ABY7S6N3_9FLAO|nr:DUF3800 domain-containing protein [Psychroserpens ponticola]WCO03555.1 DUF3800 domain-containing protein [Psychroserpens ponticola]